MHGDFDLKLWLKNFFESMKGFTTVCIIFAIAFYIFYVFDKPDFAESEQTYNALKEIAYTEAERQNTDYEITDILLKYEVSTVEDGFKHVTLIGKDNVNFTFYLSADYEIVESIPSWRISTATVIFAQILTSSLIGMFGGIAIYSILGGFDTILTSIGSYKSKNK